MLFNSVHFAIFFLIVTTLYFLLPHKYRWALLLIASYYFYMAWIPIYVLLLIASTIVDYISGILLDKTQVEYKRKIILLFSLCVNLGILFTFKYYNFFMDSIEKLSIYLNIPINIHYSSLLLPIGISFYTFQTLAYTIDVYRRKVKPERHLGIFALYVSFFPQLVAGPIERADTLIPQLKQKHEFDIKRVSDGLKLMAWGLFKKVVVADRLGMMSAYVFAHPQSHEGPDYFLQ